MKISIILLMSFCILIPKINAQSDIETDIDFELYKHYDISPIHTSYDHEVDFDDAQTTFDTSYDGGGSENDESDSISHDEKQNNANYHNDDENDEENEHTENDNHDDDNENDDHKDNENETDDDDDDDDDEETTDESKTETTTIKAIDPKGTETVDPKSIQYISPDDVSHRLSREKRSKKTDRDNSENDDDFARSYRDFVREHFGIEEAKTLSDNNKKKKPKKSNNDEHNNNNNDDEAEEDEDYEEGAEDGETEDDISNNKGNPSSAQTDEYYDDDSDEKDNNDDDNDDDSSGSYEDDDYKNVKKLSQETDENPEFCKTIYKDNQECQVCKNPKTHDKSETCSYSSSPTPKRYAYKKEKNYHSNDDPDDIDDESDTIKDKKTKSKKNKGRKHNSKYNSSVEDQDDFSNGSKKKKPSKNRQKSKNKTNKSKNSKESKENQSPTNGFQPSYPYYHGYQDRRTSTPLRNHYFNENNDDLSFKASESFPVTASSETYDKDIDIFKGRDWSHCTRKINKENLTCYYCKDSHGATQEECMYIPENNNENLFKSKSNKNIKRNTENNRVHKKSKKNKKNNINVRKSSPVITTKPTKTTTTTATTATTVTTKKSIATSSPTTIIPNIITSPLNFYDSRIINQNLNDENKFNNNLNLTPKSISSVSWQTNHNQPKPRTLNRNQNFNSIPIPILHQNFNLNPVTTTSVLGPYENSGFENLNNNNNLQIFGGTTIKPLESPVKTLEYTEPRNGETLKRMIKLKISHDHNDDDSNDKLLKSSGLNDDATVFYSKVLRKL